jgi:hypothetical protein
VGAKIFLTFLASTFVLFFGITDIIRRLTGKDYVIKVGNNKIGPMEFKLEKSKRLNMLRNRGQDVDDKSLTANIIHQLIWENVIDQATKDFGIIVSDETLQKYISGMNMFRDKDGRFNARLLRGFLQQIQVGEAMFLESSRKDIKSALLKAPFAYISILPESEQFVRANVEKRSLSIVELKPSSFQINEKPTKEELEEFYNNNSDVFVIDETRSLRILELQESSIAKNITIPEDEIKEAYEQSSERDERSFDDMKKELESTLKDEKIQNEVNEITRKIEDALMAGTDVAEVAKQFSLNVITIDEVNPQNRNSKSKGDVIKLPYKDDVIAVAFSVDEGTDSSFSETLDADKNKIYWLLHVDRIVPKHVDTFENSSEKVTKAWIANKQHEKAREMASDFVTKVKEGSLLKQLASQNKKTLDETQPFDRFGKVQDEKNKKFSDVINNVYENAFELGKNEANYKEINESFFVYQVKDVITPKEIDKKDEEKYQQELRAAIVDDLYQQLVSFLSKREGLKINHELLKDINEEVTQESMDDIF